MAPLFLGRLSYRAWTPRVRAGDRGGAPGKSQGQETSPRCSLSAHSWMGQSPGARAALLLALAAALERREPALSLRLERHGVELKAAQAEVELSVTRLRAWGARAQAQSHSLQVSGPCGRADRAGGVEWGRDKGSGVSHTWGPSCDHQRVPWPLYLNFLIRIMGTGPTSDQCFKLLVTHKVN